MKRSLFAIFVSIAMCSGAFCNEHANLSADEALNKLKIGNEHYQQMLLVHPNQTKERREELTKGQHPFAVVLTCSDSRVPPEIIFDQGLGDIFVIRNAGNVLDEHVKGSIEYAVEHLGVKLVVVMGHECCGAVTAAVKGGHEGNNIDSLIKSIKPAIKKCETKKSCACKLDDVIKENAIMSVDTLTEKDPTLEEAVKEKCVKIIPAYYHLDTGKVDFLNK